MKAYAYTLRKLHSFVQLFFVSGTSVKGVVITMIKTAQELVDACKKTATQYKTLYVMGGFGSPMTAAAKRRAIRTQSYNRKPSRNARINQASSDTFGFDCSGLIKGLLWGWEGNTAKTYGGAFYRSNGVPDKNADSIIAGCKNVSTDFSGIQPGEALWCKGHIGIYIGDGLAVESTPQWADGVQITACANVGNVAGYPSRTWTSHGRLPWVAYPQTRQDPAVFPALSQGSKGETVRALQILLTGRGFSCGSTGADGIFGKKTAAAVKAFQLSAGITVSLPVTDETWRALLGMEKTP